MSILTFFQSKHFQILLLHFDWIWFRRGIRSRQLNFLEMIKIDMLETYSGVYKIFTLSFYLVPFINPFNYIHFSWPILLWLGVGWIRNKSNLVDFIFFKIIFLGVNFPGLIRVFIQLFCTKFSYVILYLLIATLQIIFDILVSVYKFYLIFVSRFTNYIWYFCLCLQIDFRDKWQEQHKVLIKVGGRGVKGGWREGE